MSYEGGREGIASDGGRATSEFIFRSRRHFYYGKGIPEIRKTVADLSAGIRGEGAARMRGLKGFEGDFQIHCAVALIESDCRCRTLAWRVNETLITMAEQRLPQAFALNYLIISLLQLSAMGRPGSDGIDPCAHESGIAIIALSGFWPQVWNWNLKTGPSCFSSPVFALTATHLRSSSLPRPLAGHYHVVEHLHLIIKHTPTLGCNVSVEGKREQSETNLGPNSVVSPVYSWCHVLTGSSSTLSSSNTDSRLSYPQPPMLWMLPVYGDTFPLLLTSRTLFALFRLRNPWTDATLNDGNFLLEIGLLLEFGYLGPRNPQVNFPLIVSVLSPTSLLPTLFIRRPISGLRWLPRHFRLCDRHRRTLASPR
ncbi:hypothetical protein NMY22_g4703 [Coprinellus aureogranulatus]|nr:hypothetical protein NMY22_g4703 [Coprinellus aureogranulatus]